MIIADSLTRKYRDTTAVNKVSFEIEKGEIVGLLGHNGAGKTTIMKMITGYLEPTAGTAKLKGLDIVEDRQAVQSMIGYLPENCPLYHDMGVIDYLEFAAALKGLPSNAVAAKIKNAIVKTRLEEVALKRVSTLSRGYRQRLGVAQAILNSPEILILDEPTNGLDPSQILEMRSLIKELAESSTIVISTHILQEVQAVCDRVLIINRGELALDSSMEKLRPRNRLSIELLEPPEVVSPVFEKLEHAFLLSSDTSDNSGTRFQYVVEIEANDANADSNIPKVARALIENNLSLYSIRPHIRDLETIFKDISTGKEMLPAAIEELPTVQEASSNKASPDNQVDEMAPESAKPLDQDISDQSSMEG